MPKRLLKTRIAATQQGHCALSGAALQPDPALVDTDRVTPKASGGIYLLDNTRVVEPRAHMARHGNLRDRESSLEELKNVFDDRVQVMRLALKINNQLLAYERRTDQAHPDTAAFLVASLVPIQDRLACIDKQIELLLKTYPDALAQTALKVPGLGPITVAALTVYIDLAKAATPSALWKYVGLDVPSHERYTKGVKGGGNKTLRTVLWNTANTLMKLNGNVEKESQPCLETHVPQAAPRFHSPYRNVYDRVKTRLAISEKVVQSRNTQGKMVEVMWKDAKPCHRHGAALRAVTKHLLADYWLVGRTMQRLSTTPLYAESQLGHTHIISPKERGWVY